MRVLCFKTMVFKLLIIAAMLFRAFTEAQQPPWDDDYPIRETSNEWPAQKYACNETLCHSIPCVGSAPPRVCPAVMPECPTKCACYMDCTTNTLTCFTTSHCTKIRRFMTKRRQARAVGYTDVILQEAQNSAVVHASTERVERNLITAAQTVSQRVTAGSNGTSGRSTQEVPSTVGQVLKERVGRDLFASPTAPSTVGQVLKERVGRDLFASPTAPSTVGQVLKERVGRDLFASPTALAITQDTKPTPTPSPSNVSKVKSKQVTAQLSSRMEQVILQSTVSQGKQDLQVTTDYRRIDHGSVTLAEIDNMKLERDADIEAEQIAVKNFRRRIRIIKSTGTEVVVNTGTTCVIFFACFYRCIWSLL